MNAATGVGIDTAAGDFTQSTNLTSARALTKLGPNTLTLTGANTYSGSTSILRGTLVVGDGATAGSIGSTAGVTVSAGGTLAFNRTDSYGGNFSAPISGGGQVQVRGGVLTLSGSNSYSGTTSLSGGVLALGNANALSGGGILTFGGGTLRYGASNGVDYSSRIKSSGSAVSVDTSGTSVTFASSVDSSNVGGLAKLGSGTLTLSAANAYGGATTVSGGVLALGAAGVIADSSNLLVNGGGFDLAGFNETVGTVTLSSGSIFGTGTLSGSSYALQGGQLNSVLGTGAITASTGTTTLGSAGRFNSASSLTISSGRLSLGGNESVSSFLLTGGELAGSGTLTGGSAYDVRAGIVSAILGGGAGLTKSTAGTVTLSGSNAYTGATLVSGGTLAFGIDNAISGSSAITVGSVGSRGALAIGAFDLTTASLTFDGLGGDLPTGSGGEIFLLASSGTATVSALSGSSVLHPKLNLTSSALFTVASSATFSLHADMYGAGSLIKSGSGTMAMHGTSYYSGGTYLTQGRINVATGNSLVFGTGTVTLGDDTVLDLGGAAIDNVITFATGTATTAVILNSGSFVSLSGPGNISSGTAATISSSYKLLNTADITFESPLAGSALVQSGGRGVFTGAVSGLVSVNAGGQALINADVTGDVLSSGSTSILGTVYDNVAVNGGTTSILGTTAVGSLISTGTGGVAATSLISGTVNGGAHVGSLGRAEFSNAVAGAITSDVGGTIVLKDGYSTTASTINNNGLVIVDRTAALALGAAIAGTGNVRVDAGSLTLSAVNTYTGTTTVLGGNTLIVNGSLANAALDVAAGATLKGSGTIAGLTTISGTHAPGNSPGVETFDNLTYNPGSAVQWELWRNSTSNSPLAYDQLLVGGDLSFTGASTSLSLIFTGSASPTNVSSVAWADAFWDSPQEWLLYDVTGSTTGFANLSLESTNWLDSSGASFQTARPDSSFSLENRSGDVYIVYAIATVPEPGTLTLAALGVAFCGWSLRLRRSSRKPPYPFS